MKDTAKTAAEIKQERRRWLEDVLSSLSAANVSNEDVSVHHEPGLRIAVYVRGELKYEYQP
jgi:hypothetical protein